MKAKEYRTFTKEELEKELQNLKLQLAKSYAGMGVARVKDKDSKVKKGGNNMCKRIRKEIARIKTIQRENGE